ncbi:hypothetical protein BDB00DRAFT_758430 [Zychaea mexicana]|uniref:uncharacterized protein n=1 Tax=Zychaea mexicana TaxID=64656 RepID=UPI0022FF32BB|nr:uncharacterized protein BDB00DRAFT_758430 [Zychaea mexicana]KAI9496547.1 hypothetical protein BDB00DRAFT_758430 [Zychaea mexicana]
MPARKQGYDAIPVNDDDNEHSAQATSSSSNLLRHQGQNGDATTRWDKIKNFEYKRFFKAHLGYILCFLVILALVIGFLVALLLPDDYSDQLPLPNRNHIKAPIKAGIPESALQEGLAKCEAYQRTKPINRPNIARKNPRAPANAQPVLLKNAVVWDGEGHILKDVDILLQDGVIAKVERDISATTLAENIKVIDVAGHVVSPGIVDMHSHLGLYNWPNVDGAMDINEATSALTPFVRSLDAFSPSDKAIRIVASGGVTTALVLPGSANLMGGEAFVFKLRPVPTTSNEDMLVQSGIDESIDAKWRWMKMACGENPKNFYGKNGRMPKTRMGEAYLFRQRLDDARTLLHAQNDWCIAAQDIDINQPESRLESRFPEDLSLESLVALLRGDVLLNVHCYETHDIEAMIRHSIEFNFTISAFHHALDAYLVPDIIKRARNNITIATFADHWGYKKEAFQASPFSPKILYEAGIPVALKSDHPVLNSQHLVFEAAKSSHYGLPPQEAFKAVTSNPAKAIGLNHRIGSLKVGYDADVVIWDREPLALGATPLQVFIDGMPLFEERTIPPAAKQASTDVTATDRKTNTIDITSIGSRKSVMFTSVGRAILGDDIDMEGPVQILVHDGKVACAAQDCSGTIAMINNVNDEPLAHVDVKGGYVIPGLVAVGSKLGLTEIPSESSTGDGIVKPSSSHNPKDIVSAIDGIKLSTRHLEEAYKGGVLTAISSPVSKNVVVGISAAFKTGADSILSDGAVVAPYVALHLQIGDSAKSDSFPTVSSQISFIRQILSENLDKPNYYGQAARGEISTIISVHNKDEIASIIMLKKKSFPTARFVVMGGAESHLVARHLAEANIPVILRPTLCTPERFDSLHCLSGAPLTNGTAAHVLHQHGVKIGLGVSDDGLARNLAWDAGWLSATSPTVEGTITEAEAIRFVTTNLQEIFGLSKREEGVKTVEAIDEFAVWSGNPLELHSRPLVFHSKQAGMQIVA